MIIHSKFDNKFTNAMTTLNFLNYFGQYLWHILYVALELTVPLWVLVLIKSIDNKFPFVSGLY